MLLSVLGARREHEASLAVAGDGGSAVTSSPQCALSKVNTYRLRGAVLDCVARPAGPWSVGHHGTGWAERQTGSGRTRPGADVPCAGGR